MNAIYDYNYWANALKGNFGAVHDGHPQCGFYKRRTSKGGSFAIVAIWVDANGDLTAFENGKTVNPDDVWTWVCRAPITEEIYRRVERGEGWPDAIETIIGSNNPPPDEAAKDEIQSVVDAALASLAAPIISQNDCDRIANHRDRLAKIFKEQESKRKAEKQPHLDAGSAVDAQYAPVLDKIKSTGEKVKAAITKWLLGESDKAKALAAQQYKAEQDAIAAAKENGQPEPTPIAIAEIVRPKAGTVGRTVALRTYKSASIVDYGKALAAVSENQEIKDLVQTLADRAARADIAMAGCEIKIEQRAA